MVKKMCFFLRGHRFKSKGSKIYIWCADNLICILNVVKLIYMQIVILFQNHIYLFIYTNCTHINKKHNFIINMKILNFILDFF
jgi:hypothetical protein